MIKSSLYLTVFLLALFYSLGLSTPPTNYIPEICDNALDDDQDGQIDLNDPDCDCNNLDSRIPNASFEDFKCCPSVPSQIFCVADWQEGNLSTPDYLNTCEWIGWDHLPVPLPLPDGQACVGFRNGDFEPVPRPELKEYIGNCIETTPLWAGVDYHFRFFVGFSNGGHSPPTNLAFYGSANCNNLPAGANRNDVVCPTDDANWYLIQSVPISGSNTWKMYEFNYTPSETVFALIIGPECQLASSSIDLYYFFDDLVITDREPFSFAITPSGKPCSAQFSLEILSADTLSYQWYRNGIALVGETSHRLFRPDREGAYQVAVFSSDKCSLTDPYHYRLSTTVNEVQDIFCVGEHYIFNNQVINSPGIYTDTLLTAEGCDSIVRLTLEQADQLIDSLIVRIFQGETFSLGNDTYTNPGTYLSRIPIAQGCDSLIYLNLDFLEVFIPNVFSPNGDGYNDLFTIFGGKEILSISSLKIFNRWSGLVYTGNDLRPNETGWNGQINGQPGQEGLYVFIVTLSMADGSARHKSGSFLLMR